MPAISGSLNRGNGSTRIAAPLCTSPKITVAASYGAFKGVMIGNFVAMPSQISKNIVDGSPATPCLSVDTPSYWRLRWVVSPGQRTIYILAQQNSTGSVYRPSLVLKSNPTVGLNSDVSGSAPDGTGWKQIGPVTFTSTGTDVVWVELHNNNYVSSSTPALFDHVITT